MYDFILGINFQKLLAEANIEFDKITAINYDKMPGYGEFSHVFKVELKTEYKATNSVQSFIIKITTQKEFEVSKIINDLNYKSFMKLLTYGKVYESYDKYYFTYKFIEVVEGEATILPIDVIKLLANIHNMPIENVKSLEISHYDYNSFIGYIIWLKEHLLEKRKVKESDIMDKILEILNSYIKNDLFARIFNHMSKSLIHGDMHFGNILNSVDANYLIDWGNCKIGPSMMDIANVVEYGSNEYWLYVNERKILNLNYSESKAEIEYYFSEIWVNINYMPFVLRNYFTDNESIMNAYNMIVKAEIALNKINGHFLVENEK